MQGCILLFKCDVYYLDIIIYMLLAKLCNDFINRFNEPMLAASCVSRAFYNYNNRIPTIHFYAFSEQSFFTKGIKVNCEKGLL